MGWVQTKVIATGSVEKIGKTPLKEQGYNGFPQINKVPFKFSRIIHRPLAIMDVCNKYCEINTVPLT